MWKTVVFAIGLLCGVGVTAWWFTAVRQGEIASSPVIVHAPPAAIPAPPTAEIHSPPPAAASVPPAAASSPPMAPPVATSPAPQESAAQQADAETAYTAPPPATAIASSSAADDAKVARSGRAPDVAPKPVDPLAPTPTTKPDAQSAQADFRTASQLPRQARDLIVPVEGVRADQLTDTFNQRRGESRPHEALDIMAPRGTPVRAVADGRIVKLFDSKPGGLTIYEFDPTDSVAYYYAHLDRYAAGIKEGLQVRQGEVIGYVGSTGNAHPDAPHLHFAIFKLGPEKRWWQGTAINPFPLINGVRPH